MGGVVFRYSIILGVALLLLGSRACLAQAEFVPKGENGFGFTTGLGFGSEGTSYTGGIFFVPRGRAMIGGFIGKIGSDTGPDATAYGAQVSFLPLKPNSGENTSGIKIDLGYQYNKWTGKQQFGFITFSTSGSRSLIPVMVSWFAQIKAGEGNTWAYPQLGIGRIFTSGPGENPSATVFQFAAPLSAGGDKGGFHFTPAISYTTYSSSEDEFTFSLSAGWAWW